MTWFKSEVIKELEQRDAIKRQDVYVLATCLGNLTVCPYDDWIACQWEELECATEAIQDARLNRFSGKWNFIYTINTKIDATFAIEHFLDELSPFIA